jgi:hypothetical protein
MSPPAAASSTGPVSAKKKRQTLSAWVTVIKEKAKANSIQENRRPVTHIHPY